MFDCLYFHIGAHKTATSSIQGTFWQSGKALRTHGIYSARQPAGVLATVSANPGALVPIRMRRLKGKAIGEFAQTAMRKLIAASNADRMHTGVISTEHALTLNTEEIHCLAMLLKPLASTIKIIYYVRHPYERLSSYLSQEVKTGHVNLDMPLENYLENTKEVLKPWIKAFGRNSIIMRPFVIADMPIGGPVEDFCGTICAPSLFPALDHQRKNTGLSHAAVLIADAMNTAKKGRFGRQTLIDVLERINGPKLTISPELLLQHTSAIDENLAYLRREFSVDLPEPELPSHSDDWNRVLDDKALAEIARVMLSLSSENEELLHLRKDKQKQLQKLRGRSAEQSNV